MYKKNTLLITYDLIEDEYLYGGNNIMSTREDEKEGQEQ